MAKLHKISLGSEMFLARSGQRVLDAALLNGVEMPHDCRAGRCGACLTRVKTGITLGGETRQAGMVHACQAMVFSDLALEVEPLPPVARVSGTLTKLSELAEDIVEVTIEPSQRLHMLPGQYCRFRFRGYPARSFSPTSSLGALQSDGRIRLHVKRVRGGRVTPSLGSTIREGHQVHIEGPFGHAFLRPGLSNRLVLIGSGTGFAPVWAVGAAALRENPERQITVIAASRRAAAFYMTPALALISRYPNVEAIATIEGSGQVRPLFSHGFSSGSVIDNIPPLAADDIVYSAGSPRLVDAVGEAAESAGALFYADPFEVAVPQQPGWIDSAKAWLRAG